MPDLLEQVNRFLASFRWRDLLVGENGLAIWSPMVKTGFSEVIGSWKIIEMRPPRISYIFSSERPTRFVPSRSISDPPTMRPGGETSRIIESEVTLLPQPDSPTKPTVCPRLIVRSMPSTAGTTPSDV